MTVGVEPAAPQPNTADGKVNSFQRIVGVFFSPVETFESIARRPDILVPLVILILVSVVSGVLLAQHIDFNSMAREVIEQSPATQRQQMSPEQLERGVRFSAALWKALAYASPFLSIIVIAIVAGVFLLAFRLAGGEGDFKQAFSVTVYSWYPGLVKAIVTTIVLMSRKSISFAFLQNPLRSNLGFLVDFKTQPIAFAMLSSLDIFTIWMLVLFVIGFAAISRSSRMKSAFIVVGLWCVVLLFKLGGAALQASRMNK